MSPFFRGLALRNITKVHCERWLTERGSKVALQTFAHELTALKCTFDYAVEQGLILGNPASHIRRRKILQATITIPTRDQFLQLINAIRLSDRDDSQRKATPGADLIELLAFSSTRLGLPPFSHHDFRHMFATTCIDSCSLLSVLC